MNREQAIAFLKTRMKMNTSEELSEIIAEEMNFVQQQELERGPFYPWFLETEKAEVLCSADEMRLLLPTDFILEMDNDFLAVENEGKSTSLIKVDRDIYPVEDVPHGLPEAYDLRGKYFLLFPIPDKQYKLYMSYVARQPLLEEGGTNAWLEEAGQWFLGRVGENVSLNVLGDVELAQRFQHTAEQGKRLVRDLDLERSEVNRERRMGVR